MSDQHASWLVLDRSGCRWFAALPAALRYLSVSGDPLAILVGLDSKAFP
jgi:hypothetical protein